MNYTESSEGRGCHVSTTVLEFTEKFQCNAEEFYRVMTQIEVRVKQRESAEGSRCEGSM
jgi:hypothetical protein